MVPLGVPHATHGPRQPLGQLLGQGLPIKTLRTHTMFRGTVHNSQFASAFGSEPEEMWKLFLLFILVPAVELVVLIELGRRMGTMATLGIIGLTGLLGAMLARRQGLGVLRRLREETALGRVPTDPVADGVIILLAAALLITPGLLTDTLGIVLLVPRARRATKRVVWRRLKRALREGRARLYVWYDIRDGRGDAGESNEPRHGRDLPQRGGPRVGPGSGA